MSLQGSWRSQKVRYWAECSGRSRRAAPRTNLPVPAAVQSQALLEGLLLDRLGALPDYCAHPLGIASATGTPTSLTLHLDAYISRRRYSFPEHCLTRLLPAVPRPGTDGEPGGIVGLRVRGIKAQGKVIHLGLSDGCGGPATVQLVLPTATTDSWASILHRIGSQQQAQGFRPVWGQPCLDPAERDFGAAYASLTRAMTQAAPAGSALLRRVALFHTVAAFYRVRCWEDSGGWKIDACVSQPNAEAHDQFIQRLCHPRWGFPMTVAHRFCWCGTSYLAGELGHTCSFYFDRHGAHDDDAEPVYLRVHTAPEGRDLAEQAGTCRAVGADPAWIRKVFPPVNAAQGRRTYRHAAGGS